MDDDVRFTIIGELTREFLLPAFGNPLLDVPGGSLLYAGAGFRMWESGVGLVGRVGSNYPQEWIEHIRSLGFNVEGIKVIDKNIDQRDFVAYSESFEINRNNPVSAFARRQMTFPPMLMGYHMDKNRDDEQKITVLDIPQDYLLSRGIYVCPMDLVTQTRLIAGMKRGQTHTVLLDPDPRTMVPKMRRSLPALLNGVTAFLPSEDEVRSLYQGETHDLWEMAEDLSLNGCEYVVIKRGGDGQYLYEAETKRKWDIPAYPARVHDVTGAGSAFGGGFLAGYCGNYDVMEGVVHGNVTASLKVEGSGAMYPLEVIAGLAEARLNALYDLIKQV